MDIDDRGVDMGLWCGPVHGGIGDSNVWGLDKGHTYLGDGGYMKTKHSPFWLTDTHGNGGR